MIGLHKLLHGSLLPKSKGFLSKLTFERAESSRPFSANRVFTDRVVYQEMASKSAQLFWIDFNLLTGSGTYTGM